MIFVKIGRMGSKVKEIGIEEGTTLRDALRIADFTVNTNEVVRSDGEELHDYSIEVESGELLLISPNTIPKTFDEEPKHIKWAMLLYNISHAPDLRAAERICENHRDMFRNM